MTVILIAIIVGIIALDQLTKWIAVACLEVVGTTVTVLPDILRFTYVHNTGMAFGMLKDHRWIFMVLSTISIIALIIYLFRFRPDSRWMQVSMAMIIGGGIGNMIDRVALGYVIDFLDCPPIVPAVFNVADSFVCVGAGIMIVYLFIDLIREIKLERAQKAEKNKNDTDADA